MKTLKLIALTCLGDTNQQNENTIIKVEKNSFRKIHPWLKEMDIDHFKVLITEYVKMVRLQDQYRLLRYMIREKECMKYGSEKIDYTLATMHLYMNKGYIDHTQIEILGFEDGACYFLEEEVLTYILDKGFDPSRNHYHCFLHHIPIFRILFFHHQQEKPNEINKEKQKRMFKSLIQYGSLFEISYFMDTQRRNVIKVAQEEEVSYVLDWMKEFEHLFNPEQKKQWQRLRLSAIF